MPKKRGPRLVALAILASILLASPYLSANRTVASNSSSANPDLIQKTIGEISEYPFVAENTAPPRVFAKSFLLLDDESTAVLASKNASLSLPIASTTKMMTAIVARKLYKLDEVVTVPAEIRQVPGSDINLVVGEKITVHELLKGLLIQSGNDAAFSLAYHLSQTNDDYLPFVEEMNNEAKSLNLNSTHYGDPAGLDDDDGRSTAFELAHIARLLLRDPVLSEIVATPKENISSVDGKYSHELKNSNRLIVGDEPYFMPQATGVKTGFTPAAGHCLVSSYVKNGRTLIGVVLNTDEYTITASASEMKKLFTWAENNVDIARY